MLLSAGDQHQWPRVCRALDKPEWEEDERFSKRHYREQNAAPINEAVNALLATMTMAETSTTSPVRHDRGAGQHDHPGRGRSDPWERRVMVEVPDPIAGTIAVSGDYWHFSRSEVPVGSTPTVASTPTNCWAVCSGSPPRDRGAARGPGHRLDSGLREKQKTLNG